MNRRELQRLERELSDYLESMVVGMGRTERREALGLYVTGLLLDGERKSIEPIAGRLVDSAAEIEGMRQRLQQCVSVAGWSDEEMRRRLAGKLDSELPGIEVFVVDDTGFPKKGRHSVGVQRQYSGTLGRTDNCQIAVSLHLAGELGSGCIGLRLYLPESWSEDENRREETGVPREIVHLRKWEIALLQLDDALRWGVRGHSVLADAGYGDAQEFRDGLTARGLRYLVALQGAHKVWPQGEGPRPGREPVRIETIAAQLPPEAWRRVSWREGSRGIQSSRFAALRVRPAERHHQHHPPGQEQWLLCEWPLSEEAPTKDALSTLPENVSLKSLVRIAKLRWRVERDYQEMKQELGLDHFEGRTWRGFHHHATLCSVAHGFLALRRALFPPEECQMDAPSGAQGPAANPAAPAGHVSPLPQAHRHRDAATRTVTDVIRWC